MRLQIILILLHESSFQSNLAEGVNSMGFALTFTLQIAIKQVAYGTIVSRLFRMLLSFVLEGIQYNCRKSLNP